MLCSGGLKGIGSERCLSFVMTKQFVHIDGALLLVTKVCEYDCDDGF